MPLFSRYYGCAWGPISAIIPRLDCVLPDHRPANCGSQPNMTFPSLVPCHTSPNWRVLSAVAASPKMGPPDVKVYLNALPTSLPGVTCGSFSQTGDVVWSPSTQAAAKEEGKRATGCGSPLHLLYCYLLTQLSPSLSLSCFSLYINFSSLSLWWTTVRGRGAHAHGHTSDSYVLCFSFLDYLFIYCHRFHQLLGIEAWVLPEQVLYADSILISEIFSDLPSFPSVLGGD